MNKVNKVLVLGAALIAMGATANAAVIDLNIYGASAQYTFWNAAAPGFLTSIRGCTATSQTPVGTKDEITVGTGCDGGVNTINLRYSSKASYDGIRAVSNVDPANTCPGQPGQRPMVTAGGATTTTCVDVHVGASDVAGSTFDQQSHGLLLGPMGGAQTDRVFAGIPTAGLTAYNPIVVPFGFFANSNIKVSTCSGGVHDGNLCTTGTAVADCGAAITCATNTISNITREQVVQIYGGNALAWTDFGASYSVTGDATASVVACLRHAGSGTQATFDKVFFTGAAPNALAINQNLLGPYIYFNDGAADEIKCVNGNTTLATTGSARGAIGYADADQAVGVAGTSQNVVAIKYNGLFGRRNTIRNGAYDFFSNQWLYENPSKTPTASAQHVLIGQLNTFAANPANLTTYLGAKAPYWASQAEMNWNKASDTQYPAFVGAANPQTP